MKNRRRLHKIWLIAKWTFIPLVLLTIISVVLLNEQNEAFNIVGRLILSLELLLLISLAVSITGKTVHSKWLIVIFFLILFCYGDVVYGIVFKLDEQDPFTKVLAPINDTLSIFFPSRGDYHIPPTSNSISPHYHLLHILSYVFFAWGAFALFGKRLINRVLYYFYPNKDKYIFWGYDYKTHVLATDLLNQNATNQPVIIYTEKIKEDSPTYRNLRELSGNGAISLMVNSLQSQISKFSAQHHFFISESKDINVQLALLLLKHFELEKPRAITNIYVRTDDNSIDTIFQEFLNTHEDLRGLLQINIFSIADLTARRFIEEEPILKLSEIKFKSEEKRMTIDSENCSVNGEAHVLLLGFGGTGQELMKKVTCDAQFLGLDYSLTIIDASYNHANGHLYRIIEEANKNGINININPEFNSTRIEKVGSAIFYEWLADKKRILDFDRIIVSLGNDELNVSTALNLNKFRMDFLTSYNANHPETYPEKILAHVFHQDSYYYYDTPESPIATFGDIASVCSSKNIIAEQMDIKAKVVNHIYWHFNENLTKENLQQALAEGAEMEDEWNACSLFDKNSSRASAQNVNNMCIIAGNKERLAEALKNPVLLERFAEMEHLRWTAFHVLSGISSWPLDDVEPVNGNTKGKLYFGNQLVRHICIVPFAQLDAASNRITELSGKAIDYKESDRKIIGHYPDIADLDIN